jgi:hypothetical protein
MSGKCIVLGTMTCFADFADPSKRYQNFLSVGKPAFKNLIESLLLYDQVYIPTNDFMPLALMIGVLGEAFVLQLLEIDVLKFVRFKGAITYIGNGGGVSVVQLSSKDKKTQDVQPVHAGCGALGD